MILNVFECRRGASGTWRSEEVTAFASALRDAPRCRNSVEFRFNV